MTATQNHTLEHMAPIIGYHRAPLSQKFGAPRQPNLVPLISIIEMVAPYDNPAAFVGLHSFSHIWLSWQFHHNYEQKANQKDKAHASFRAQVRPPRLGGNQKIGVFASRSMYRPSGLGLSVVKLERIEIVEGRVLLVISGADMIDATPIIDIKPYVAYSDAHTIATSGFAQDAPTVVTVTITEFAQQQFIKIVHSEASADKDLNAVVATTIYQVQQRLLIADMALIKALIAQDPRPAYRRAELQKMFVMRYKSVDISFMALENEELQITAVKKIH